MFDEQVPHLATATIASGNLTASITLSTGTGTAVDRLLLDFISLGAAGKVVVTGLLPPFLFPTKGTQRVDEFIEGAAGQDITAVVTLDGPAPTAGVVCDISYRGLRLPGSAATAELFPGS